MTLIDLGGQAAEPVSLAELKTWCRIERDDEDVLIETLIRAARGTIEAETGLVLARRAFRLYLDPVPADGWVEVARRPLHAVTQVTLYDAAGVPVEVGPEEAVIERALGVEAIRVSPRVRREAANGVEIEFEAGFAPGEAPENLALALRRIAAAAYELRANVPLDQQPAVVPALARALIAPYRRVRL